MLESDGEWRRSDGDWATGAEAVTTVVSFCCLGPACEEPRVGSGASSNSKTNVDPHVGQTLETKKDHMNRHENTLVEFRQ